MRKALEPIWSKVKRLR